LDEPKLNGFGRAGKASDGSTGRATREPPRQVGDVKGGWNYAVDAYRRVADGRFFYRPRTDDMIVSAGYNIAAVDMENAFAAHAAVAECAGIGVADDERGQIVKTRVVLRPGQSGDEAMVKALQDFVKATAAPYKYPRPVELRESLPRTETGKLRLRTQLDDRPASTMESGSAVRRSMKRPETRSAHNDRFSSGASRL